MQIPTTASWIVKKIIGARYYLQQLPNGAEILTDTQFSIGKVYIAMRGDIQRIPWQKLLCCNVAPPKYTFIMWLTMWGRLSTCDHLQKFGIFVDPQCCLCDNGIENLDHLFFECRFAADIWNRLATWCGARRAAAWSSEQRYLLSQCKAKTGKQKLYRLLVTIAVNLVWRERNKRKFQGMDIEEVVKEGQMIMVVSSRKDAKLARSLHATII